MADLGNDRPQGSPAAGDYSCAPPIGRLTHRRPRGSAVPRVATKELIIRQLDASAGGPGPTATPRVSDRPLPHVRIEPGSAWSSIDPRDLWRYRDLIGILAGRDVRLRYKQTVLGILWVVLQPLAAALIFAAIFGRLARLPSDGVPYVLFVFAGLLPWNLASAGVLRAASSIVQDARLITKVYFPRAIVPLASLVAVVVDFAVAALVMLALMVLLGAPLGPTILAAPLFVVLALLVAAGLALLFAALNVYYRDFGYALPFLIQVWLFASPVVYSSALIPPGLVPLYALNPMVGVIDGMRWSLFGQGPFPVVSVLEALVIGGLLFALGAVVFGRVERSFADVI